ncbi:MAG TPA: hypothetical protein VGI36_19750 [Candidatus Binataceae bacterium]
MAVVASVATLWSTAARATITQGDFSVFGFFESRTEGRWGQGSSANNGTPTTFTHPTPTTTVANVGLASSKTGGTWDFNHWDLDEMRFLGDIRPDYHVVKNYKFMGRFDTLILKDADFFAFYRPWYDTVGTLKDRGRAITNNNWFTYTQSQLQQQYLRNDLHEYYGQLNFTDNFSMRVGKQQVIWSEADALSGTEVTNPVDATFHGFIPFEAAEDLRKNVRMVKFNYILPDFEKTANNELEAFWIPGDFQGNTVDLGWTVHDARNPWAVPAARGPGNGSGAVGDVPARFNNNGINFQGQPIQIRSFLQTAAKPLINVSQGFGVFNVTGPHNDPSNSLENSEFGARASSLLPIGNGLQASFIYLYEWRNCPVTQNFAQFGGPFGFVGGAATLPGQFFYGIPGGRSFHRVNPAPGVPVFGTIWAPLVTRYRRNSFFGLTGTYYDKEWTDIVYRYDSLYTPNFGVNSVTNQVTGGTHAEWAENARFILAGDRPTYIPWLSKQHTFFTAQYVNTWFPDRPTDAVPSIANTIGKVREDSNFFFVSAVDWILNGQLVTTNVWTWDIDDAVGALSSTNTYRYSRSVLFGVNAFMAIGKSGRYTDPFLYSAQQRTNELEFTMTYEI